MIDQADNVATALQPIGKGTSVSVDTGAGKVEIVVGDDIPYGHKFALTRIAKGEAVRKYGCSIGDALSDIDAGQHVHMHNVAGARLRGDLSGKGWTCRGTISSGIAGEAGVWSSATSRWSWRRWTTPTRWRAGSQRW